MDRTTDLPHFDTLVEVAVKRAEHQAMGDPSLSESDMWRMAAQEFGALILWYMSWNSQVSVEAAGRACFNAKKEFTMRWDQYSHAGDRPEPTLTKEEAEL